jgi:hypothetical protein
MTRRPIGIYPSADLLDPGVAEALGRLAPVRFESCPDVAQWSAGGALISLSGDVEMLRRRAARALHWFHVAAPADPVPSAANGHIRFADSPRLDGRLRGRRLPHHPVPMASALPLQPGDEVLAWRGQDPVWVARPTGPGWAQSVSAPLPTLVPGQRLSDYLNEAHFIQALPLLHFLRQVTGDVAWQRPPLRACIMFDDPNLHWPSYGFLSYPELARQARAGGFHVAFATVPLDAWATHPRAADLFRQYPSHLSLLIHGNDHLRAELGRTRPPRAQLRLLAQGLRRVARLETSTGLHLARVMAPPHGAYTEASLAAMLALGFEGACISRGSLRAWNPQRAWPSSFGLEMAEVIDQFPVIHRFRLSEDCEGHIAISAFLDRPIIPVGHHDSVAGGLELLSRVVAMINSVGPVHWMSPELMLRSNHLSMRSGGMLRVRPYSSRLRLTAPRDITAIALEASADLGPGWQCSRGSDRSQPVRPGEGMVVTVTPGETVELVSSRLGSADFRSVEGPGPSPWALPRRILCEARDRVGPLLSTVGRRARAGA